MKIKRIIDISRHINPEMVTWPGDPAISFKRDFTIAGGDKCNVSSVNMGLHTGTHTDAPLHYINDAKDVSSLDLSGFIGFVKVFEIITDKFISYENIKDLDISEGDILFLKTSNSSLPENTPFNKDFIYLEASAAEFLLKRKIKTVGVDYLSVDSYHSTTAAAHMILLSNDIRIIESLYLKDVKEGTYFFSSLPMLMDGADGSPVRAVLLELE